MNIKRAKQQIISTIKTYSAKDKYGRYLIPKEKQRPLLLIGAPGIGKSDIVSQVAAELNIGFLPFSMIHYTRQSARDENFIKHKLIKNLDVNLSVHSENEIISTIHDMVQDSGLERGILFFDEINHESEVLDPVMRQFLQYKIYGCPALPEGWIVIAAGNEPEYNNSARKFDVATLDKFKCINIEPNFDVWKDYAYRVGMNAAVVIYLAVKPQNFFRIENTSGDVRFVTARGWEDLSKMMNVYETLGAKIDKTLVSQYIHHNDVADDFTSYYQFYKKYRNTYNVNEILAGKASNDFKTRMADVDLEERYIFIGVLLDVVCKSTREFLRGARVFNAVTALVKSVGNNTNQLGEIFKAEVEKDSGNVEKAKIANNLLEENEIFYTMKHTALKKYLKESVQTGHSSIKDAYDSDSLLFNRSVENIKTMYTNLFGFCEEVYGHSGNEMAALVTELAINGFTSSYIANFGCDEYHKYDKKDIFKQKYDAFLEEISQIHKAEDD